MGRHLVCLTYDFDALSLPIARGTTTPTPLSRGEFGLVGAARIRTLLNDHGIPATFFVPGHTVESFPEAVGGLVEDGHEIAHHGWTHRRPADLTREEEAEELARGSRAIEALAGKPPRGYRSPSWDLSPHTLELLMAQGFLYDSSLMGHDYQPYRPRIGDETPLLEPARFGREADLVELPVSWSLDDYPSFEWSVTTTGALNPGLASWRAVLENWCADFDYLADTEAAGSDGWGLVTYTFHPFVSGRGHRMKAMAALIEHVAARGAVFVTMEQAAEEWLARQG